MPGLAKFNVELGGLLSQILARYSTSDFVRWCYPHPTGTCSLANGISSQRVE
jgi:hypothetical protein